jgi:two-component system response regulator MprA
MAAATAPSAPARRRILVVDDDPRSRSAVARLLAEEGYDAEVAADGEEASGLLGTWDPDLVLTDLDMPRLDGRALVQRVRSLRPGTPVLVLSARSDADVGAPTDGFFPKPIQIERLLARIRDLVGA